MDYYSFVDPGGMEG